MEMDLAEQNYPVSSNEEGKEKEKTTVGTELNNPSEQAWTEALYLELASVPTAPESLGERCYPKHKWKGYFPTFLMSFCWPWS